MSSNPSASYDGGRMRKQPLVGLEVLYRALRVKTRADALVAAVHWILVTNGFRAVQHNDDDNDRAGANALAAPSELLSDGWNSHSGDYVFKYVHVGDKVQSNVNEQMSSILVKISFASGILIINVTRYSNNDVLSVSLNVNDYVSEDVTNYANAFKDLNELQSTIERELIDKIIQPPVPLFVQREIREPLNRERFEDLTGGPYSRPTPLGSSFPDDDFGEPRLVPIGRGDLDPLGRHQGGMLMDPRDLIGRHRCPQTGGIGPERLPRGAVPPGARFDPFGPPIPDLNRPQNPRFVGPDPDHLPPPGYNDMFG